MKTFIKVFLSGILLSFVCMMLGALAGGILSGFIPFHWIVIDGVKGYESGISVVGTLGMIVGGTLGSWLALPRSQKADTFLVSTSLVFILALVSIPGGSVLAREFHLSEYLDEIFLFLFWLIMPFIIARRAMLAPIVS